MRTLEVLEPESEEWFMLFILFVLPPELLPFLPPVQASTTRSNRAKASRPEWILIFDSPFAVRLVKRWLAWLRQRSEALPDCAHHRRFRPAGFPEEKRHERVSGAVRRARAPRCQCGLSLCASGGPRASYRRPS